MSYLEFLNRLLRGELTYKEKRSEERRMKMAGFPFIKTIDEFDFVFQRSITRKQVNQLLDMQWIEKCYNLILGLQSARATCQWLLDMSCQKGVQGELRKHG